MMNENGFGSVPENKTDYKRCDIYRNMAAKEKIESENKVREDTIKFASELDEKILPLMPKSKNASLIAQRQLLGIIAERQARLQAQIDWLKNTQEKYRKLRDE